VALSLLCAVVGFQLGGALFGSPTSTNTTAAKSAVLPSTNAPTPSTTNGPPGSASSIATQVDKAVVNINTVLNGGQAAGTGMVLTADGLVMTNNHVIAGATDIRAQINGSGPIYSATVVGYDITHDVALLQLQGASNLDTIAVGDSSKVAVNDPVIALGNALGRGGTPAMTQGTVTAIDQTISAGDAIGGPTQTLSGLIQISAALLPGDSGGPLVSSSGQVIGMDAAASATGRRTTGVGFAIPINTALDIVHQIQSGQSSSTIHIGERALLGVQIQDAQGAAVVAVEPGSPASSAGIGAGDVIVSVGDATIAGTNDLMNALDKYHPGDKVSIGWRGTNGQHHSATVTLTSGPPA
jgi:S1-C subfamily serine protease